MITTTTTIGQSAYGYWSARLDARMAWHHQDTGHRFRAAIYRLAAQVEEAIPAGERWCLALSLGECTATIEIEGLTGTREEAERALKMLEGIR